MPLCKGAAASGSGTDGAAQATGIILSPAMGALFVSLSTVVVAINAQLMRRTSLWAPPHPWQAAVAAVGAVVAALVVVAAAVAAAVVEDQHRLCEERQRRGNPEDCLAPE